MGCWGTHFDRTQTWWEPGKALVRYWQRCQALLQWGQIAPLDFSAVGLPVTAIHRSAAGVDLWFVANPQHAGGELLGFANSSRQVPQAIAQANLAGGFHAGDPLTMQRSVALAGFNVGVELGQLGFIGLFLPVLWWMRQYAFYCRFVVPVSAWLIVVISLLWLAQRALNLQLIPG